MAVVKINVIDVPEDMRDTLEERFAQRAHEVEQAPGFLGFELLRPADGETRYFVYTRWESDEAFQAWRDSPSFTRGHAQANAARGPAVSTGSSLLAFDVVMHVEVGDGSA